MTPPVRSRWITGLARNGATASQAPSGRAVLLDGKLFGLLLQVLDQVAASHEVSIGTHTPRIKNLIQQVVDTGRLRPRQQLHRGRYLLGLPPDAKAFVGQRVEHVRYQNTYIQGNLNRLWINNFALKFAAGALPCGERRSVVLARFRPVYLRMTTSRDP